MKLPTREEWMNEKLIGAVMRAKGCDRANAVTHLDGKFRCMEEAAKTGAGDKEIAEAGMPLTPEEFFAYMFTEELRQK